MQIETKSSRQKFITARSARFTARLFNIGNIISLLPGMIVAPLILLNEPDRTAMIFMFILMVVPPILWFGLSIMIYIIARHHPNERVGYYTQHAAYRYYGMIGLVIPVGTFFGTDWRLWIITGGIVGFTLVPWSFWDLFRVQKERWQDISIEVDKESL